MYNVPPTMGVSPSDSLEPSGFAFVALDCQSDYNSA